MSDQEHKLNNETQSNQASESQTLATEHLQASSNEASQMISADTSAEVSANPDTTASQNSNAEASSSAANQQAPSSDMSSSNNDAAKDDSKVKKSMEVAEAAAAAAAAAVAAADAASMAAADAVAAANALNQVKHYNNPPLPQAYATAAAALDSIAAAANTKAHDERQKSDVAVSGLDYSNRPSFTNGPSQALGDSLPAEIRDDDDKRIIIHGTPASRGIAVGRISFLQRAAPLASKMEIEDVDAELARFEAARTEAIAQLGTLYEVTVEKLGEQNAVVFQIHQMMLDDPEYVDAIESTIRDEKANAEYAVEVTGQRFSDMFTQMDNDYMQGRAADVIDVSRRLSDILSAGSGHKGSHNVRYTDEPILLATDDLAPSETVQLDQNLVRGIITSEGSARSHTVIFARTLGLPAVINLGHKLSPDYEGKMAIVDGGAGIVLIDPDEKTLSIYAERKRTEDALRARLEQFRGLPTKTLSGRRINLYANIGAVSDLDLVKSSDAEGIGLFRSEYIYLQSSDFPSEESQYHIYKETLLAMEGKKVVIRTLDIGADKTADYFMLKHEENPAMGMRAIRICLTRPDVFKTQLRALYRASAFGTLAIMFPMISSVEEVKECLRLCDEVKAELKSEGKIYSENVELGIMIETPASAVISDLLAEYVDFFSIGTNDLTQFTLAVDRQNAEVGRFLNPYHRAVIRLIEMTVANAHKNGIWVGVCGELAADEGFTHELVRIGVDEISVVPSSVLMIRARISTLG